MTIWTEFLGARGATFERDQVRDFGDSAAELVAARDTAVVCDLAPLGALRVAGADAGPFLHGQLTSDVLALARRTMQLAASCSPKGRMLANFVVVHADDESYELLLPLSLLETVRKRLGMFVLRSRVTIEDASAATVRLGIGGPFAAAAVRAAWGEVPDLRQCAAVDGARIVALHGGRFIASVEPARAAEAWNRVTAVARPAGFPAWEWLRIRAGVPVITPATSDQYVPQMANWDALDGVSFEKGCYTGQEIVARMQYLGRLKERLALAHVEAPTPAAGDRLFSTEFGDQACGTVVNAAPAPGGGADLLAVLQIAARDRGSVHLGLLDGPALAWLPLPYPLPAARPPRGRIA